MTEEIESTPAPKALPRPSLQQHEDDIPRVVADSGAADVQFVLATAAQCMAHVFEKGGDMRYAAQNAIIAARTLLGAAVAVGILESETMLEGGEALWINPAVPAHGQSSAPRNTGGQLG